MDNEKKELVFPEGISINQISKNFFSVGINLEKFNNWAKSHTTPHGYVNLNICQVKDGEKYYFKWNDYKFTPKSETESKNGFPF